MAGGKGAAGCVEGVSSVSGGVRARFDDSDWSVGLQIEVVVLDEVFENEDLLLQSRWLMGRD